MYKCEIRKQLIREIEKYEELKEYKLFEKKIKQQRTRHLRIIREKIKELEKMLEDE